MIRIQTIVTILDVTKSFRILVDPISDTTNPRYILFLSRFALLLGQGYIFWFENVIYFPPP
jgi:hypothetical protein